MALRLLACVPRGTRPPIVDAVLPALLRRAEGASLRRGRDTSSAATSAVKPAELEDAALRAVGAITDGKAIGTLDLGAGEVERLTGAISKADVAARVGVGEGEGKEGDSDSDSGSSAGGSISRDDPLYSGRGDSDEDGGKHGR